MIKVGDILVARKTAYMRGCYGVPEELICRCGEEYPITYVDDDVKKVSFIDAVGDEHDWNITELKTTFFVNPDYPFPKKFKL